jgi:hypothetical protein
LPPPKINPSTGSSRSPTTPGTAASSSDRLTYPYSALLPNGSIKPAIPVLLKSLDGTVQFPIYALPDSGADRSCFPKTWAKPLGIVLADCDSYAVNTGNGKGRHQEWGEPLKAIVAGREIELAAQFGNINVGVLGRDDFFQEFLVTFDDRKRVTIIEPYESAATAD